MKQRNYKTIGAALLVTTAATLFTAAPSQARTRRIPASSGCWIRIWKDNNHGGWYQLIRGPRQLPNLKLGTRYWGNRISGISTGPRTWVKVFKDQGLRGGVLIIPPNTNYGSLKTVGFNDAIDSMLIQNHPFK